MAQDELDSRFEEIALAAAGGTPAQGVALRMRVPLTGPPGCFERWGVAQEDPFGPHNYMSSPLSPKEKEQQLVRGAGSLPEGSPRRRTLCPVTDPRCPQGHGETGLYRSVLETANSTI